MKSKIHQHNSRIQEATRKPTDYFRNLLQRLRSALLFCILLRLSASLEAQQSPAQQVGAAFAAEQQTLSISQPAIQVSTCPLPVYFNYHRRQLQYNGRRMDGITFLNMCRSIPDTNIQHQVERYDDYTAQKQKLGFGTVGSSFAGMAFLGGALGAGNSKPETTAFLVFTGVVCVLAVPVTAICGSVPHQKRKTVLFRDLPVVYNAYVETQRRANGCQ